MIEPKRSPVSCPFVLRGGDGAGSSLLKCKGVAAILGLHLGRLSIGAANHDSLQLVMDAAHSGEVLNSRGHPACLRQPHEEVEPNEGVRGHLVEINPVPFEDSHHSRIQWEAKTGREKNP